MGAKVAIRALIRRRGAVVLRERRRVRRSGGIEAIHDLRVATRRLEALLRIGRPWLPEREWDRLRRRSRRIRRGLARRRDADVLARWVGARVRFLPGIHRSAALAIAGRLRAGARHPADGEHARSAGRSIPVPGIRRRIDALLRAANRARVPIAARAVREAKAVLQAAVPLVEGARRGEAEGVHLLRLAIKRYRYALEVAADSGHPGIAAAIAGARRLQGCLGRVHDHDVMAGRLRALPAWRDGRRRDLRRDPWRGARPAITALLIGLDAGRRRALADLRRALDRLARGGCRTAAVRGSARARAGAVVTRAGPKDAP
jgi:CHAD domain-containing protein